MDFRESFVATLCRNRAGSAALRNAAAYERPLQQELSRPQVKIEDLKALVLGMATNVPESVRCEIWALFLRILPASLDARSMVEDQLEIRFNLMKSSSIYFERSENLGSTDPEDLPTQLTQLFLISSQYFTTSHVYEESTANAAELRHVATVFTNVFPNRIPLAFYSFCALMKSRAMRADTVERDLAVTRKLLKKLNLNLLDVSLSVTAALRSWLRSLFASAYATASVIVLWDVILSAEIGPDVVVGCVASALLEARWSAFQADASKHALSNVEFHVDDAECNKFAAAMCVQTRLTRESLRRIVDRVLEISAEVAA